MTGYNEAVVGNLLQRLGRARVRNMIRRWIAGASDAEIARRYHVCRDTAGKWRRAFGRTEKKFEIDPVVVCILDPKQYAEKCRHVKVGGKTTD